MLSLRAGRGRGHGRGDGFDGARTGVCGRVQDVDDGAGAAIDSDWGGRFLAVVTGRSGGGRGLERSVVVVAAVFICPHYFQWRDRLALTVDTFSLGGSFVVQVHVFNRERRRCPGWSASSIFKGRTFSLPLLIFGEKEREREIGSENAPFDDMMSRRVVTVCFRDVQLHQSSR